MSATSVASVDRHHCSSEHVWVLCVSWLHHPCILLPVLLSQQLSEAADTGWARPGASHAVNGLTATCSTSRCQQGTTVLFSPSQLLLSLLLTLALCILHQSTSSAAATRYYMIIVMMMMTMTSLWWLSARRALQGHVFCETGLQICVRMF